MKQHLSQLELDAAALGAISPEILAHLATCADCRSRGDEGEALRAQLPAAVMSRTLSKIRRRKRVSIVLSVVMPLVVAAAALLVLRAKHAHVEDDWPEIAVKGGPSLQVYALHNDRVFQISDGAKLRAGDEIRFAVIPAGAAFVLIASVDGRGQVTIYVPYDGERSAKIDPRHRTELPGSIVLDDATGPERIFAVFSTTPIAASDVLPALQGLAATGPDALPRARRLDLRVPATQASLLFEKEAP